MIWVLWPPKSYIYKTGGIQLPGWIFHYFGIAAFFLNNYMYVNFVVASLILIYICKIRSKQCGWQTFKWKQAQLCLVKQKYSTLLQKCLFENCPCALKNYYNSFKELYNSSLNLRRIFFKKLHLIFRGDFNFI